MLAPLSLLVLESVLVARSLMLFVRDRLPLLEPGRTNSLNFSHLRWTLPILDILGLKRRVQVD